MVKVREDHPILYDGSIDCDAWLNRLSEINDIQHTEQLKKACLLSQSIEYDSKKNTISLSKLSAFRTGLEMVDILSQLKVETDCLIAAILYRHVREKKLNLHIVETQFGKTVAELIKSVQGMAAISKLLNSSHTNLNQTNQLDNVRKMLVSIIDDVRVALIKLAERTCAIRSLDDTDISKCKRVAQEVFEVYAPLAHRLGIGYIKWELEDLSFRYLKPEEYKTIANLLDEKRLNRQQYIDEVIEQLKQSMIASQVDCEIYGRPKHIYSIWRKMKKKNLNFRELYDIRAFRIITKNIKDCYTALGVVHSLYNHVPQEFDDYITTPKENGYRSLHTAVFGPFSKTLEVQIRTEEMHDEAELGVCAHWKYKGTDTNSISNSYEEKLNWLRQVMEWHEELEDIKDIAQGWRSDIEPDRIYVFTRQGHVIDLPLYSTPIDFAFRIHTEIGLKCRGAKIGGRIVPLNHHLKTGDHIEILTSPKAQPSRDWLNPNLGYIATSRARAKIISWLKKQNKEENILNGHNHLEAERKRLSLQKVDLELMLKHTPFENMDDLHAAIGAGDMRVTHVIKLLQKEITLKNPKNIQLKKTTQQKQNPNNSITIDGVGNLLTNIANCCRPVPGDQIIGYITISRGVSIHRQDCSEALYLQNHEPERLIQVDWGDTTINELYTVEVQIIAYDRSGLLRDITMILANEKVNLLETKTKTQKNNNIANMHLSMEINSLQQLSSVLAKIDKLPNVIETFRHNTIN